MKTKLLISASALTVGLFGIAGAAIAVPFHSPGPVPRTPNTALQPAAVGGPGAGMHTQHATGTKGTIDASGKTALAALVDEEKMAFDLYTALAAKYPDSKFARVVKSEAHHLEMVRGLFATYDVADPTADLASGKFVDADRQRLYDSLLMKAAAGLGAAYQVGIVVEQDDIDLLDSMSDAFAGAPDVQAAMANLRAASERHLASFSGNGGQGHGSWSGTHQGQGTSQGQGRGRGMHR